MADPSAEGFLFDIDGTLITTGGASAVAWRRAFDDLYGIPADIGQFSDAGMTDPEVGASTCASGSHVWNGNIGTLNANASAKAANIQNCSFTGMSIAYIRSRSVE